MRFEVIRYPTYWVVIDHKKPDHEDFRIVFESRGPSACRTEAARLNREWAAGIEPVPKERVR